MSFLFRFFFLFFFFVCFVLFLSFFLRARSRSLLECNLWTVLVKPKRERGETRERGGGGGGEEERGKQAIERGDIVE